MFRNLGIIESFECTQKLSKLKSAASLRWEGGLEPVSSLQLHGHPHMYLKLVPNYTMFGPKGLPPGVHPNHYTASFHGAVVKDIQVLSRSSQQTEFNLKELLMQRQQQPPGIYLLHSLHGLHTDIDAEHLWGHDSRVRGVVLGFVALPLSYTVQLRAMLRMKHADCGMAPQDLLPREPASSQPGPISTSYSAFVRGFNPELGKDTVRAALHAAFSRCGTVTSVKLLTNGRIIRNMAFVDFATEEERDAALALQGADVAGGKLLVDTTPPPLEKQRKRTKKRDSSSSSSTSSSSSSSLEAQHSSAMHMHHKSPSAVPLRDWDLSDQVRRLLEARYNFLRSPESLQLPYSGATTAKAADVGGHRETKEEHANVLDLQSKVWHDFHVGPARRRITRRLKSVAEKKVTTDMELRALKALSQGRRERQETEAAEAEREPWRQ